MIGVRFAQITLPNSTHGRLSSDRGGTGRGGGGGFRRIPIVPFTQVRNLTRPTIALHLVAGPPQDTRRSVHSVPGAWLNSQMSFV